MGTRVRESEWRGLKCHFKRLNTAGGKRGSRIWTTPDLILSFGFVLFLFVFARLDHKPVWSQRPTLTKLSGGYFLRWNTQKSSHNLLRRNIALNSASWPHVRELFSCLNLDLIVALRRTMKIFAFLTWNTKISRAKFRQAASCCE